MLYIASCNQTVEESTANVLTLEEELWKLLFFETRLSDPEGLDCSDCHDPELAFSDPDNGLPVSKRIVPGRYGNHNDMTITYAAFIPLLNKDSVEGILVAGLFWDGRANTLSEQAMDSPLNPFEMGNRDTASIAGKT